MMRNIWRLGSAAVLALLIFAGPSRAQIAPKAAVFPAKGDVLVMLGTHGGPGLTKERSEPATLLVVDGTPYLIDCGIGTMRRLLDAGVPSQSIRTIFITHNHPDHALGLVDVLANDFLSVDFGARMATRTFDIYGPPETPSLVDAAYNYIRIPYSVFAAENLGASTLVNPFRAHAIDRDGLVYHDDKIRVTAAENTHYQLMAAKYRAHMKSFAYRFETPYGAIVFTGDTGPSDAVTRLAEGADVLVSEVEVLAEPSNAVRQMPTNQQQSALAAHMRME
ncbi:MAG: MBL fold metallo-hydrolase, partial [Terracidiphilus sp.]